MSYVKFFILVFIGFYLPACSAVENKIDQNIGQHLPKVSDASPRRSSGLNCEIKTSDGSNACLRQRKTVTSSPTFNEAPPQPTPTRDAFEDFKRDWNEAFGNDTEDESGADSESGGVWECTGTNGHTAYGDRGMLSDPRFVRSTCHRVR